MDTMVTVELNGKRITADRKTIGALLLGDVEMYISDSKGPIKVSEMSNYHIKNAMRKIYIAWINDVFDNSKMTDLLSNLRHGPQNFQQFDVLLREMSRRVTNRTW